ncbi:hypothetical protein FHS29_003204 [Saccharothrix tamanrassetensis]|uniref:Uncharacterized protein n=1 Tax=Saccharothrix tamanrassetensis TaxID=1051531 RepID=A0A841CKB4_9PSEU|nr:hypothetical protein [Saccharothrix tamanrassetensis]
MLWRHTNLCSKRIFVARALKATLAAWQASGEEKRKGVVFSPHDLSKTTTLVLGVQAKSVLAPPGQAR